MSRAVLQRNFAQPNPGVILRIACLPQQTATLLRRDRYPRVLLGASYRLPIPVAEVATQIPLRCPAPGHSIPISRHDYIDGASSA